jgi:hypothetical protein
MSNPANTDIRMIIIHVTRAGSGERYIKNNQGYGTAVIKNPV